VNGLLPVTGYDAAVIESPGHRQHSDFYTLQTEITQVIAQYRQRRRDNGSGEWFPVTELGGKR